MQQDVFDITELDTIGFACVACQAEVILRAERPRDKGEKIACPLCHRELPGASNIFDRYHAVFDDAKKLGTSVSIKLRSKPPSVPARP